MTKPSKIKAPVRNDRAKSPALAAPVPNTQARLVAASNGIGSPICGVVTKKGTQCQQAAMANGRCRFHGGKLTGTIMARPGNRNAVKHGTFLPGLLDEREQKAFDLFVDDLFRVVPELNDAGDLRHAEMAAFAYVRMVRAFVGDAASSTIDDLSRIFTRHLAAIRVNRDQRVSASDASTGPRSPAEYAVEIIQQVRMYAKGGTLPAAFDPGLLGLSSSSEVLNDAN